MQIDRRHFIASLGGAAAVKAMSHEARAEALEAYMVQQLNAPAGSQTASTRKFPRMADVEAQIETRFYRRGVGNLFLTTQPNAKVKKLAPMPAKPAPRITTCGSAIWSPLYWFTIPGCYA